MAQRQLGPKLYGIFPGGRLEQYIQIGGYYMAQRQLGPKLYGIFPGGRLEQYTYK